MSEWSNLRVLLFACGLLIVPAMVVWDGWSYVRLTSEGVTTTAVVTGKTTHRSNRSTRYDVEYRFRDDAGRRWSGSQSIEPGVYARLRVSQRIDIVYCRSKPDLNVAYLHVLRERVGFLSFASFVIALVAGSLAWWWHYAQGKTQEHDAAMRQMRTA